MERRFTPQEKKQNRYDRDHVALGWKTGTKYRKKLRLKKVLAERSLRRNSSLATHGMLGDAEVDAPMPAKPRRHGAGPALTVRELLEKKAERREGSHGAKAYRRAWSIESSARTIENALRAIVRRRRMDDLERLRDLRALARAEISRMVSDEQMAAFLRQHPTWMTRLREWRRKLWSRSRKPASRPQRRKHAE